MTIFASDAALAQYLHLKLATNGWEDASLDAGPLGLAHELLESYREKSRLLAGHLCPPDRRLQDYLERHFADVAAIAGGAPRLPDQSFMLDKPGLARLLSLPVDRNEHHIPLLSSYRTKQGVLHNPKSDRRTTAGSFHVCAGGLPVPGDKKEVPKVAFARLFHAAVNPPADDLVLPYTATRPSPARCFVSLLIRPLVSPAIPSDDAHLAAAERTMEVRMFAPGSLVANLDFVEAIFGNAGNPHLPENDAALDTDHWTGNSGCLILAPHLVSCRKKDLGLPHVSAATPRQVKDGMCWSQEGELYNEGQAFKATCRTAEGVMVTLIADNYFGYCKKEVKTQISLAANLFGNAEEEHAGGALAFPSYDLGEEWRSDANAQGNGATWDSVVAAYGSLMEARPEGWGIDRRFPTIIYVPEDAAFTVQPARVVWHRHGRDQGISLRANHTYILPSGYKVRLEKHPGATPWRLVGTVAEAVFCHKPSTVSGGGKSEISKSIADAVIYGPQFVGDLKADLDQVAELLIRDYSGRLRPDLRPDYVKRPTRSILAPERSLGSVIKLFTPTTEFTDAYNTWLKTIPRCILTMLFCLKRLYRPEWGEQWRQRFSVDIVNGEPGHQLKVDGRPVTASYLRVGIDDDGSPSQVGKVRGKLLLDVEIESDHHVIPDARSMQQLRLEQIVQIVQRVRSSQLGIVGRFDAAGAIAQAEIAERAVRGGFRIVSAHGGTDTLVDRLRICQRALMSIDDGAASGDGFQLEQAWVVGAPQNAVGTIDRPVCRRRCHHCKGDRQRHQQTPGFTLKQHEHDLLRIGGAAARPRSDW